MTVKPMLALLLAVPLATADSTSRYVPVDATASTPWAEILGEIFGTAVEPDAGQGSLAFRSTPGGESEVRYDVLAAAIGHYTTRQVPERLVQVRVTDPKWTPQVSCQWIVLHPEARDGALEWSEVATRFEGEPWFCGEWQEQRTDSSGNTQLQVIACVMGAREARLEAATVTFSGLPTVMENGPLSTDGACDASQLTLYRGRSGRVEEARVGKSRVLTPRAALEQVAALAGVIAEPGDTPATTSFQSFDEDQILRIEQLLRDAGVEYSATAVVLAGRDGSTRVGKRVEVKSEAGSIPE